MVAAEHVDVGDVRRLSVTNITNAAGVPTDPTTLVLKVRKPPPTSTLLTYTYGEPDATIVHDSTGNFHADILLDAAGTWKYDYISTGAAKFAEGNSFYVRPQQTA